MLRKFSVLALVMSGLLCSVSYANHPGHVGPHGGPSLDRQACMSACKMKAARWCAGHPGVCRKSTTQWCEEHGHC